MKQFVCWSHRMGARKTKKTTTSLQASDSDNKRTFEQKCKLIVSQYWGTEVQETEIQGARQ